MDVGGSKETDYGRAGRPRQARPRLVPAGIGGSAGDRTLRSRRDRLLGPEQKTAWWGLDDGLVRWGHLLTFPEHPTFAFMVSPRQARAWQERLRRGDPVRLRADRRRLARASAYLIPTAVIPGRRRTRRSSIPATSTILAGSERQRQRLRRHPRGRPDAAASDQERRAAAAGTHHPLRLARRDRRHDRAPERRPEFARRRSPPSTST